MPLRLQSGLIIIAIVKLLAFTGCGSVSHPPEVVPARLSIDERISRLISKAQNASPAQSASFILEASELLLNNQRSTEALKALEYLNYEALSNSMKLRYLSAYSQAQLVQSNPEAALEALTSSRFGITALTATLGIEKQLKLDELRAEAYEAMRDPFSAARERIFFNGLLHPEKALLNQQRIWENLLSIPFSDLLSLPPQSASPELSGWVSLALISKQNTYDIDKQRKELDAWLTNWPGHPAALHLPKRLAHLMRLSDLRPQHIALLLPLSGQLSGPAEAVRNGFLANYYHAKINDNPTPIISIYDTESSTLPFNELYLQASQSGADLIIGPLKKDRVALLKQVESLPVTTISLNYAKDGLSHHTENLYEFGLAPEDEARQVALKAFYDGHDQAAILYPDNAWGYRLASSFVEHWQNTGGEILAQEGFPVKNNYGPSLKSLLSIPLGEARARRLKKVLDTPVEYTPRRRKDVDFIALFALPNQAKQVKPGLAFYFADDIPLYATSHINDIATTNYEKNKDLNGIEFCEIPWFFSDHSPISKELDLAWQSRNKNYERLIALGTDSYLLSTWLAIVKSIPDSWVSGYTGTLRLLKNNKIERSLSWATMENGKASSLAPPILDAY